MGIKIGLGLSLGLAWLGQYAYSASPPPNDLDKLRWIEKTARALRQGQGLSIDEDPQALLALSRQQIIDQFMKDPRFGDTLLDFNMFFLGAKPNQLKTGSSRYTRDIFIAPNAIAAAQSLFKGGDFSPLFSLSQPMFMGQLRDLEPRLPEDKNLAPDVLRPLLYGRIQASVDSMIQAVKDGPKLSRSDFRVLLSNHFFDLKSSDWPSLNLSFPILSWINLARGWYGDLWYASRIQSVYDHTDLVATLQKIKHVNDLFFQQLSTLDRDHYKTPTILDIRSIDLKSMGVTGVWSLFNPAVGQVLPNSSTNDNRKRSAFILSRFFCDDLTPINVIAPDSHPGQGQHASDDSCRACHYKLDPMAGFFRDLGRQFFDFSPISYLNFDDGVVVDRDIYDQHWKAPKESGREWDVGYVRGTNVAPCKTGEYRGCNNYGESLEDLMAIIRNSDEPKRCYVKRLFEYFVAENQSVDAGYMDDLVNGFKKQALNDPAGAVKSTISRILLGNTFSEPDPIPQKCYDFPAGYDPSTRPPCQIAYLLTNNCTSCHGDSTQKGGLNLSRWITLPDGSFDFPHVDKKTGQQHSRRETLESILDRMTTSDEDSRMPYKRFITNSDREALYLWVKSNVDPSHPGGKP